MTESEMGRQQCWGPKPTLLGDKCLGHFWPLPSIFLAATDPHLGCQAMACAPLRYLQRDPSLTSPPNLSADSTEPGRLTGPGGRPGGP